MHETFFQKLQRVKLRDIGHIFLFMLAFPVSLIYRLFRRDLWLICDNEMEARDNGYRLFQYICEKHPETDAVYAISRRSPDRERVCSIGKTVGYGSLRHWILYLSARYNISSQKGGKPNAAVCYFLEVNRILRNRRIFLQHGVIHNDNEFLHYSETMMKMFVVSIQKEYEFVCEKFGYPQGAVKKLGLCRFDYLHDADVKPRQILLMPTWRSWIATPTSASYDIEDVSSFTNTEYYKAWSSFLSSPELHRILEENDMEMVFYPHRDMQSYLGYFDISCPRIRTASWPTSDVQQLLKESAYLITDYSSIAMDFAYMRKPMMYYQFDYDDFRKGQYKEGYFSYERDGFGPVVHSEEEAFSLLEEMIKNRFEDVSPYKERKADFFDLYDDKNCERNYNAIKEL